MTRPAANYDEDELVTDLAEGVLTYREIAAKHGISVRYVSYLVQGVRRPDLQPKIDAAARAIRRQAYRLGASMSRVAWKRLAALASGEQVANETQRKAAADILKMVQYSEEVADLAANALFGPNLADLSEETKARVLTELGGPDE